MGARRGAAVRARVDGRHGDAVLGATLVAAGLGCLSLGDCHERPQSVAERALGRVPRWGIPVVRSTDHQSASSLVGSIASRKVRSWVTTTSVPSYARSACSSCSTASRSRWFVGSSRTRRFTSRACSSARCALVRSPGDSVRPGTPDVVGAEPELGEQRAGIDGWRGPSSRRTRRGAASRRARRAPGRSCRSPSCDRGLALPASSGSSPSSMPSSVDLPLPLRPVTASRSPGHEVEVDRAEREVAAPRRRHRRAGPRCCPTGFPP